MSESVWYDIQNKIEHPIESSASEADFAEQYCRYKSFHLPDNEGDSRQGVVDVRSFWLDGDICIQLTVTHNPEGEGDGEFDVPMKSVRFFFNAEDFFALVARAKFQVSDLLARIGEPDNDHDH